MRSASAFILPSFSEGLPMSVLEAWSYHLPVLMTEHCNLPEGFAANAAIRIGTGIRGQESGGRGQKTGVRRQGSGVRGQGSGVRGQGSEDRGQGAGVRDQGTGDRGRPLGIDEGIRALFEMTAAERVAMGQRGRTLVEQHFTWPQVAAQMKEVYEWVLGGGAKPGCVRD